MNDMFARIYSEIRFTIDDKSYALKELGELAKIGIWARDKAIPALKNIESTLNQGKSFKEWTDDKMKVAKEALEVLPGEGEKK